ncbi:kinase-like protein [Gyrodon lividus]|nr:kinase-like protein [Gyrodon lividus]
MPVLTPTGKTLVKAKYTASSIGHALAPLVKEGLNLSTNISAILPIPGVDGAAKALLSVWVACQMVHTNRLKCLRLVQRCAMHLCIIRRELGPSGKNLREELMGPIESFTDALNKIHAFLQKQIGLSFWKQLLRREETEREIDTCDKAITDVRGLFGLSIQMSILKLQLGKSARAVCDDLQSVQSDSAENAPGSTISAPEAVDVPGLVTTPVPEDVSAIGDGDLGKMPPPPPTHASSSLLGSGTGSGTASAQTIPTPPIPAQYSPPPPTRTSASQDTVISPHSRRHRSTHACFAEMDKTVSKMNAQQNDSDKAEDMASLQEVMNHVLSSGNDFELLHVLGVKKGEVPEAMETLRSLLNSMEANEERAKFEAEYNNGGGVEGRHGSIHATARMHPLDRELITRRIDAMTTLNEGKRLDEECVDGVAEDMTALSNLPNWMIQRYDLHPTSKIGSGIFSDVYIGHRRDRIVAVKVLAPAMHSWHFVHEIDSWRSLRHENVLRTYDVSSVNPERHAPWFVATQFCSGGNLVKWLGTKGQHVDLLRCMHNIAKGMRYLHEQEVVHGDLKAENILVTESGRCVVSDFGQIEMKYEAFRWNRLSTPSGILPWQAPELLLGNGWLTPPVDVYAFAICCVEMLGMGELSWKNVSDSDVAMRVISMDERPLIPSESRYTDAVTDLVHKCWARNPDSRPSFSYVAAWLKHRRRDYQGCDASLCA